MKSQTLSITLFSIALLSLALVLLFKPVHDAFGSAFTGQASHLQSATTTVVGNQAVPPKTIFANDTTDSCKARIITTRESAISISFGDTTGFGSTTLTGASGHIQLASTTVAYDSGIYGCGLWTAYGYASTTLTVSQF